MTRYDAPALVLALAAIGVLVSPAFAAESTYSYALKTKQQIESATGGQKAPAPAASGTAPDANPFHLDAPKRRAGWWEFAAVSDSGSAMGKQFLCVGNASEKAFSAFDQITNEVMTGTPCTKRDFQKTATGWAFETKCSLMDLPALGDLSTVTKGTISGDIATKYQVKQTVTSADGVRSGVINAAWTGTCPPGRKEGDLADEKGDLLVNMME